MKYAKLLLLLPLVVSLSGCLAVVAAGAAGTGVLYAKGKGVKSYPYGMDRMFNAAVAAADDVGIMVKSKTTGHKMSKIHGTTTDGKNVKIDVKSIGDNVTEVKVRVGTLGNHERADYIISRIDAHL